MHTLSHRLQIPRDRTPVSEAKGSSLKAQLAQALEDKSQRFILEALIDQIPDFLFVKDCNCRFTAANAALARTYGQTSSDLIGKTDHDLHPPERADTFLRFEQEVIKTGVPIFNMEETFPDADGAVRWYSTTKLPLRDSNGSVVGLIGVARDTTERKNLELFQLRQSDVLETIAKDAPLHAVLNQIVSLIETQTTGLIGSISLCDAEAGSLRLGAAPGLPDPHRRAIDGIAVGPQAGSCGTAVYRRERVVVSDVASDPLWRNHKDLALASGIRSCWSTPVVLHDGSVMGTFALYSRTVRSPIAPETLLMETAARLAGIAIERHRSKERLLYMAHHDGLTGLPNRALCLDRLHEALTERRSKGYGVAFHYIDLDGFKSVNDTLGHVVGDVLLRQVADRLRKAVPQDHTVARLGGDEFAVIQSLDTPAHRTVSAALAHRIVDALNLPYAIQHHRILAGASVGIAIAPEDDEDPDALMRDADLALYRAKAEERGGVRFFEPEMNLRAEQRHTLEIDLRHALERNEFELFYQPQIAIASKEICGFEALLRWRHPEQGLVSPLDFIGVAEEIGLIIPIGEWVLRQACAQAALWPSCKRIAVNLSPVQFKHPGLFDSVLAALAASNLSPHRLELEITESVLLLDSETNLALLHRLRTLGVQISLDDFGTGYSSLSYLRSFPFTKIKIDRSFVRDLETNPGCLAIIRAVSRLASDLGMTTTAEGVETHRQLDQLRDEGCDEAQGFLFSPPVPAREVPLLLEALSSVPHAA